MSARPLLRTAMREHLVTGELFSGRWDDTDVVHVVAENLRIRGNPGGLLDQAVKVSVPVEVQGPRNRTLAVRWLIQFARVYKPLHLPQRQRPAAREREREELALTTFHRGGHVIGEQ